MSDVGTVFMFSGQGSQYFQMGRALFEQDGIYRRSMLRMDSAVRDLYGYSVIDELYSDKNNKNMVFDEIAFTHPAIFMVEYSLAQLLISNGVEPDITLGASMGSFAAAAVAGYISPEDSLRALVQQAKILEECCEPGGMIAVLGNPEIYSASILCQKSELAAINFSSHFVVAAKQPQCSEIEMRLRTMNVSYQRLPVSFAFHSRWIDMAQEPFESFMSSVQPRSGKLPIVCCSQEAVLRDLPPQLFWSESRHPIRFREAIVRLGHENTYRYLDVGPAGTLATFLKYGFPTMPTSNIYTILSPYGSTAKNLASLTASDWS
jgi:bacillaene synthase trans-acting acyltransferase